MARYTITLVNHAIEYYGIFQNALYFARIPRAWLPLLNLHESISGHGLDVVTGIELLSLLPHLRGTFQGRSLYRVLIGFSLLLARLMSSVKREIGRY